MIFFSITRTPWHGTDPGTRRDLWHGPAQKISARKIFARPGPEHLRTKKMARPGMENIDTANTDWHGMARETFGLLGNVLILCLFGENTSLTNVLILFKHP